VLTVRLFHYGPCHGPRKRAASAQEKPDTKVLLKKRHESFGRSAQRPQVADTDKEGHKVKAETSVDSAMNDGAGPL